VAECSEGSGSPNHHFSLNVASSLHKSFSHPLSPSPIPSYAGESPARKTPSLRIYDSHTSSQSSSDGMFTDVSSSLAEKVPRLSTTSSQIGAMHLCGHNECQAAFPDVDLLISHIESSHPAQLYTCGNCNAISGFKLRKDFRRHLTATKAHALGFRCRCAQAYPRKEKFRAHVSRETCLGRAPYICACGHSIDSQSEHAVSQIRSHVDNCGRRQRGRPRLPYSNHPPPPQSTE
jgi:uncharacterized C2H2 Zn-finger protein